MITIMQAKPKRYMKKKKVKLRFTGSQAAASHFLALFDNASICRLRVIVVCLVAFYGVVQAAKVVKVFGLCK